MVVNGPGDSEVYNWLGREVKGLGDAQLDFDSQTPEQE
jgi:hypothetical protein